MTYFLLIALFVVLVVSLVTLVRRIGTARRVRDRAFEDIDARSQELTVRDNWLSRWLMLAGYRSPSATGLFVTITGGLVVAGIAMMSFFYLSGAAAQVSELVGEIPGGVGATFAPLFYASPWILAIIVAMIPFLVVRRSRLERVAKFEQDLPLAMDLIATLTESGLGFDTALSRVFETRLRERPLATEFRTFQADMLAGRGRVDALRRLTRRVEVPSLTILVSALVQAEQMGMSIAGVMRRQAEDLRDRRRERANTFAMSLPVKRLVPMVLCFLPGIFVWALGPVMIQLFQVFDRVIESTGAR